MDQVKFVDDSLWKILLGPFLNILTYIGDTGQTENLACACLMHQIKEA